jgi:hypothetical protein
LWLIKVWFSASTFVVKIATFAKPQNVMRNTLKILKTFVAVLLFASCSDTSNSVEDELHGGLFHSYSVRMNDSASVQNDTGRYASGYYYVGTGSNVVISIHDVLDNPEWRDVVTWKELLLEFKDTALQLGRSYSLNDTTRLKCRAYRGGAWIGIIRLSDPNGALKIVDTSATACSIQFETNIIANETKWSANGKQIITDIVFPDTTITFQKYYP